MTTPQRLRVIGQEFEAKKLSDFEVLFESEGCRVRGVLPPRPPELAASAAKRRGWGFLKPASPPPSAVESIEQQAETWTQRYTWSEIERLDEERRARRAGPSGAPGDYDTSQILRVVGAFADHRRWRLASVSRTRHLLKLEYVDEDGRTVADSYKFADMYDFASRQVRSRSAGSRESAAARASEFSG